MSRSGAAAAIASKTADRDHSIGGLALSLRVRSRAWYARNSLDVLTPGRRRSRGSAASEDDGEEEHARRATARARPPAREAAADRRRAAPADRLGQARRGRLARTRARAGGALRRLAAVAARG